RFANRSTAEEQKLKRGCLARLNLVRTQNNVITTAELRHLPLEDRRLLHACKPVACKRIRECVEFAWPWHFESSTRSQRYVHVRNRRLRDTRAPVPVDVSCNQSDDSTRVM